MTGEVRRLYFSAESTYGTSLTTALTYTGVPVSIKPKVNFNVEEEFVTGSRGFNSVSRGPYEAGFSYSGKAQAVSSAYDWTKFFALYAFGATSGIQDGTTTYGRLGSFTAEVGKTQGATSYYNLYNGCMIDELKISADAPGKAIMFDAEILAQYVEANTTKTYAAFQSIVIGADPTIVTTAILTWKGILQINIGAGGLTNVHPTKWSLTVRNNLQREPGVKTGNDAVKYPLAAIDISEGKRQIIFEMTLPAKNETYTAAKLANSAVTALTIPIDDETVTLAGGIFVADDLPELKQDLNEETVKMIFNGLTIA
jgi:hypothetical protein